MSSKKDLRTSTLNEQLLLAFVAGWRAKPTTDENDGSEWSAAYDYTARKEKEQKAHKEQEEYHQRLFEEYHQRLFEDSSIQEEKNDE